MDVAMGDEGTLVAAGLLYNRGCILGITSGFRCLLELLVRSCWGGGYEVCGLLIELECRETANGVSVDGGSAGGCRCL